MRPSSAARAVTLHAPDGTSTTWVAEGESLLGAARRLVVGRPGEVVALDLSADPAIFALSAPSERVVLRPMGHGDLPWLVRWRNAPRVARWWEEDPDDLAGLTAHHGPDIGGSTTTRLWIAEQGGRSVGFLQDYPISEHPEYAVLTGNPDAVGVDYLVGEDAWAGRGFGTRMLWEWVVSTARSRPGAAHFFAAPDHRNLASRRVLLKVGFTEGVWFDEPTASGRVDTVVGHTLDVAGVVGHVGGGE